uniref:Cytochrome P450 71D11-like n=1 Tax=Populus alba TaxID=43335 RepID=A0A4U5QDA0_POPAL|nr:cytochrome P450 71D11-like [Populus alba]
MQILLGEVRFVVISSRETAKEVMKINENIFVDRPDGVIPRIVFYSGKAISFTPYGEYWKQLRKICSSKLLSPQCVRSLRSTMEEEVSDFATSISSKEGSPINLSKMLFTLTFGLISRVIMGKKGNNQALLSSIEEWKQGGAEMALAKLLYHFDCKLCDGVKNEDLDMTEDTGLGSTVKRKHELYLIPIPYHPSSPAK